MSLLHDQMPHCKWPKSSPSPHPLANFYSSFTIQFKCQFPQKNLTYCLYYAASRHHQIKQAPYPWVPTGQWITIEAVELLKNTLNSPSQKPSDRRLDTCNP